MPIQESSNTRQVFGHATQKKIQSVVNTLNQHQGIKSSQNFKQDLTPPIQITAILPGNGKYVGTVLSGQPVFDTCSDYDGTNSCQYNQSYPCYIFNQESGHSLGINTVVVGRWVGSADDQTPCFIIAGAPLSSGQYQGMQLVDLADGSSGWGFPMFIPVLGGS